MNNQGMEEEQYNIVVYGISLLLNSSVKIAAILLISALLGWLRETLIVLLVFCSMRYWAGGYHCKTDWGCFLAMSGTCLLPNLMMHITGKASGLIAVWMCMLLFSVYEVIRYAPRNSRVNPIEDTNILRRKRMGSILECVVIAAVVFYCRYNNICWLIVGPLFIEAITISPLLNQDNR